MSTRLALLAAACCACTGARPAMPSSTPTASPEPGAAHPGAAAPSASPQPGAAPPGAAAPAPAAPAAQPPPRPRQDVAALAAALDTPERAVDAYLRAGDAHDAQLVRAAFHPTTELQWIGEDGEPRALTQIAWWPRITAAGPPALTRRQRTLDRSGALALIEADSRWATHRFDDLLLVVQHGGRWQIVGKIFQRLAPGEEPRAAATDDADIRRVLAEKIAAHAEYDPALLRSSHLPGCRYAHVDERGMTTRTLSEGAADYAAKQDAGITDHDSPWRIVSVTARGAIGAAILEVQWQGRRHLDHLLLLKTAAGWRIAAAAWGPAELAR